MKTALQTKLKTATSKTVQNLQETIQAQQAYTTVLLKTATSKTVQNLQETVQAQQAYTTVLLGHKATIHTKLAHLDKQIQIHCIYPHQHSDTVQLNTPDYDPDIDGDTNPTNAVQPSIPDTAKKETVTSTTESEDHNTIHNTAHRSQHQSATTHSDSQTIKPNNIQQR